MKIYVHIIRNKDTKSPDETVYKWASWISKLTGYEVETDYSVVDVPIDYKVFIPKNQKYNNDLWGLKDIKETLRKLDTFEDNLHHFTFFFYNPKGKQGLANWTYPDNFLGSAFIEIPFEDSFVGLDAMVDVLKHESVHGMTRLHWFKHNYIQDNLDNEPNLDEQIKRVFPFEKIFTEPKRRTLHGKMQLLIELLTKYVKTLSTPDLITKFALAIQRYEGWYPGSLSYRNNNPGNIRFIGQSNAVEGDGGFAQYPDYRTGFEALKTLIRNAAEGKSQIYSPNDTILQFFEKYAPNHENDSTAYALFVAKEIGRTIQTNISELV